MSTAQTCQRCGTCCRQGGPALHGPDLELIRSGELVLDDLVTVRRGELAVPPMATRPERVEYEFLKLRGRDGSWCCVYYDDENKGCLHYHHRPLACRQLDCTDVAPLLELAGRDLLTRFDCLDPGDPLLSLMREHEQSCPCPDLQHVSRELEQAKPNPRLMAELEAAVVADLAFRDRLQTIHRLSLGRELFAFGRPLFHLLLPLGLQPVGNLTSLRLVRAQP